MTAQSRSGLLLSVALFAATCALPAAAQEEAALEPESIDLRLAIPSNSDIPPQLIATVRDAAGNVIPGIVVQFDRELEFLGTKRMAPLGQGATDIGGAARLVVQPRQEQATVVASVPGADISTRIDATFPEERVDPFFDPEHEHGLLTPLRTVMPPLIAALVAVLWVFVIGLAVSTVRRIRHLGKREEGQVA